MVALDVGIDTAIVSPIRRRRRTGNLFWCAVVWIAVVFAAAVLANLLPLPNPADMDMLSRRMLPNAAHWLGTDGLGRDELSRLVYGARISLSVGLIAPMIGLAIGGSFGILAGYFRGRFETVVTAGMDVLLAFPPLVLALAVIAFLGQSIVNVTLVLG